MNKLMNPNMEKLMSIMNKGGLQQAFVINAILQEAERVISFYEENPEKLNEPQIVNPQAWLELAKEAKSICAGCVA